MPSSAMEHRPLLRDSDIRRYFAARIVSLTGSAVTYVVMPVLVYGITGSATWTAFVAVAEGIPYLLTGLWAGALADHVDRRRMMVTADVSASVVLMTIPIAWWLGTLTAPHVLIAAFMVQTVFVFFDAANNGALPSLVARERLPAANSLVFGGATVVETIVPGIAGLLLIVIAPASLVAVNVVTFLASALLVRAIVRPLSPARRETKLTRHAVAEGLMFIVRHPIVRIMTVVGAMQSFSGGAFIAVLVAWADQSLNVREGDWQLGLLYGAWGAGAVIGSVIMPRVVRAVGAVRTALLFLPLSAIGGIATALASTWVVATLAIGGWAVMYMVVTAVAITLRQQVTPEPLMSRVMTAGRMLAFGAGYPVGALVAGVLAGQIGPAQAMLVCQFALVLGSAIAWISPLRAAPRTLEMPADVVA